MAVPHRRSPRAKFAVPSMGSTTQHGPESGTVSSCSPARESGPPVETTRAPAEEDPEGDPEVVAQLPDIDSLDMTSDFTVFLRKGVPEVLRRKALRKLWGLDPVFANLDGLNNYDEDYTKLGMVKMPGLKSVYQAGRGVVLGDEDQPEADKKEAEAGTESDADAHRAGGPDESPESAEERVEGRSEADPAAANTPDDAPDDAEGAEPGERPEQPAPKRPSGSARARRWGGFTG